METLYMLLELRSVSRAAERMGISQPALSRTLARLRDSLSDPLLVRSGGGMVLTPRAEALREPLGRWLAEGRALLQPARFDPAAIDRCFRIASTDYGLLRVIRRALGTIMAAAPGMRFEVETLKPDTERLLARGDLDIVVSGNPFRHAAVHWKHLFAENFLSIARRGHPALAEGRGLALEDFLSWPQIAVTVAENHNDMFTRCLPHHVRFDPVLRVSEFSTAPYLVTETDAFMTLPAHAARLFAEAHDLVLFAPPLAMRNFDYSIGWHARSRRDPETLWLIERFAVPSAE